MQARLQEDFWPLDPQKTWVSSHFPKKNERITNVFEDCGSAKHVAIWYQRGQKIFWPQHHYNWKNKYGRFWRATDFIKIQKERTLILICWCKVFGQWAPGQQDLLPSSDIYRKECVELVVDKRYEDQKNLWALCQNMHRLEKTSIEMAWICRM